MRTFNYTEIRNQKWDSDILGLIAAIYKEAWKMGGRTKSVQNYISTTYPDGHVETLFTPLAPYETPEALDRICAEYKDLYYDALGQAQNGWHEGNEDVVPFIKYLLGTVLAAYKDFEDRFALVKTSVITD